MPGPYSRPHADANPAPVTPAPLAVVVGGGPAGLMAAEVLAAGGARCTCTTRMPSVGRKFLLAGKGGLNLTHAEDFEAFVARYGARRHARSRRCCAASAPQQLRDWAAGLGIDTFVGSSGRVFPTDMKAAPLLRAWLHRLRAQGVQLPHAASLAGLGRRRRRGAHSALRFDTPQGESVVTGRCGGAGAGRRQLVAAGFGRRLGAVAACAWRRRWRRCAPSNCGFDVGGAPRTAAARMAGATISRALCRARR